MNLDSRLDVLLVEDDPADAEATIRTLRRNKLANDVVWVRNGAEALEHLFGGAARRPSLILLDLRLPKLDGVEVLKRIRAEPRMRSIPVVVMTSSTQEEDVVRSYDAGANSFVSKPVQYERFAEVVAQLGMYWLLVNRVPAGTASS